MVRKWANCRFGPWTGQFTDMTMDQLGPLASGRLVEPSTWPACQTGRLPVENPSRRSGFGPYLVQHRSLNGGSPQKTDGAAHPQRRSKSSRAKRSMFPRDGLYPSKIENNCLITFSTKSTIEWSGVSKGTLTIDSTVSWCDGPRGVK